MDDLVERLEKKAKYTDDNLTNGTLGSLYREAAAEIRSLREQVTQAETAEARARLEGAEIMREAAARWAEDGERWDDCCIDTLYDYECAIRALDPAAILEARARAKAMDELIAGDGDTL